MVRHFTKALMLVLPCASAQAFGLNAFDNRYYLELSAGNKEIRKSTDEQPLNTARVGKLGFFAHFSDTVGLGLTTTMLEYSPSNAIGTAGSRGLAVGAEARLLTPALSFWDSSLRGYAGIGGTIRSIDYRQRTTAEGEESLTLTGSSQSAEIRERFERYGGTAALGLKMDFSRAFGLQAEYGMGREKWLSKEAEYNGNRTQHLGVQEGLRTAQWTVGFSLIN
jgi:hypothetical protein